MLLSMYKKWGKCIKKNNNCYSFDCENKNV